MFFLIGQINIPSHYSVHICHAVHTSKHEKLNVIEQHLCKALEKRQARILEIHQATCYKNYDQFLIVLDSLTLS